MSSDLPTVWGALKSVRDEGIVSGNESDYATPGKVLGLMSASVSSPHPGKQHLGAVAEQLIAMKREDYGGVWLAITLGSLLAKINYVLHSPDSETTLVDLKAQLNDTKDRSAAMVRGMRLGQRAMLIASGWGGNELLQMMTPAARVRYCSGIAIGAFSTAIHAANAESYSSTRGTSVRRIAPFLIWEMPTAVDVLDKVRSAPEKARVSAQESSLLFNWAQPSGDFS
jgi:hypothetical protein